MTKTAGTDKTEGSGQDAIDVVIADSASAASNSETADKTVDDRPAEEAGTSHGGRNFILILLLIVAAVAGSLALSGKFMPLYQSLTARLHHIAAQQHEPEKATPVTSSSVVANVALSPEVKKPVDMNQPMESQRSESQRSESQRSESQQTGSLQTEPQQLKPVRQAQTPAVSSQEVQTLLSSINGLRDELQQMSEAQQALQNGLKEQQQMNLQVRLRWIADPASRLPQLQLTWEEISLLPGLSDSQRSEAVRMHRLARARVQQLKQWQDALSKWADALVTPVHRNILPEPKSPWLAWIVSQFQLRQAPSVEARQLGNLRARLLDAARHLTLESWPAKGAWQRLQAELLLQIRAIRHDSANASDDAIETGLPASFEAIQNDINTLRHTALQWQQGGVQ